MSKKSGSSLFLMEMLMVVLFFILCASTCILVFVKSNNISRLAKDTNQSVIVSESLAEFYKAGEMESCMKEMNGVKESEGLYVVGYDQDWEVTNDTSHSEYRAAVQVFGDDKMEQADITITRISDHKTLYQLKVTRHKI